MITSGQKRVIILSVLIVLVLGTVVGWRFYQSNQKQTTDQTRNTVTRNVSVTGYIPGADNDPYLGQANAKVKIIAFEDFQCPYCKAAEPIIMNVVQTYPNDVQYVYRDFPLYTIHPNSKDAAEAANCALEQGKFWQYHDLIFDHQQQLGTADIYNTWANQAGLNLPQFTDCFQSKRYADEIQHDQDEGILAGVNSTPTYFVNGKIFAGVQTEETWNSIIESFLK